MELLMIAFSDQLLQEEFMQTLDWKPGQGGDTAAPAPGSTTAAGN